MARPRRRVELEHWQPRLWLVVVGLLVLVVYLIAFVTQNSDEIRIDFVLFTASVSLIWLMLLGLAIGFVGGALVSQLYGRRTRRRSGRPQPPPRQRPGSLGETDETRVDVARRDRTEREPR